MSCTIIPGCDLFCLKRCQAEVDRLIMCDHTLNTHRKLSLRKIIRNEHRQSTVTESEETEKCCYTDRTFIKRLDSQYLHQNFQKKAKLIQEMSKLRGTIGFLELKYKQKKQHLENLKSNFKRKRRTY